MSTRVINCLLPFSGLDKLGLGACREYSVHGLIFLPEPGQKRIPTLMLATHGLTAHKASLLNWSLRLGEAGVASILFDLPGHYLGGWSEVPSFDWFCEYAHQLYGEAFRQLTRECQGQGNDGPARIVLAGHSLGGLLALKALELEDFKTCPERHALAVGFGLAKPGAPHLFDTPFYQKTFQQRAQLISPLLDPQKILFWIREQKEGLKLQGKKIHLLSGHDDIVANEQGVGRMAELLQKLGNQVSIEHPKKLPHHAPELAAPHIKSWFDRQGLLSL